MKPNFALATRCRDPFPHASIPDVLPHEQANRALTWLMHEAPWKLRVESFYEQHEFCLEDVTIPDDLAFVVSADFIATSAAEIGRLFGEPLPLILANASAHRLSGGQTIRIHNDYIGDKESHRLLIQLNSGWKLDQGGLLMLFEGCEPSGMRAIHMPVHGSGFAFEISERSYHAVSSTIAGERFTLVYTFRREVASG